MDGEQLPFSAAGQQGYVWNACLHGNLAPPPHLALAGTKTTALARG